jgi:hypothetical protein
MGRFDLFSLIGKQKKIAHLISEHPVLPNFVMEHQHPLRARGYQT